MAKPNVSCETLFKYKIICAINKLVAPTIYLCAQHNIYACIITFWRCIVLLNRETIGSFSCWRLLCLVLDFASRYFAIFIFDNKLSACKIYLTLGIAFDKKFSTFTKITVLWDKMAKKIAGKKFLPFSLTPLKWQFLKAWFLNKFYNIYIATLR